MNRFRAFLMKHHERGDVVETVFMVPIAIFIMFAMINLSSYFSVRAQVQNVARDGARLVALYGGNSPNAIRNNSGKPVETAVLDLLWDGNKCKLSYCASNGGGQIRPIVDCTPDVATAAGQTVTCNIKYEYSPLAPVPPGLEGLNGVFGQPMSVTATFVSETGRNG